MNCSVRMYVDKGNTFRTFSWSQLWGLSSRFIARRGKCAKIFSDKESDVWRNEDFLWLCRVEAYLNSRPLTPMRTSPTDSEVLTPTHFLIGGPFLHAPEPDLMRQNIDNFWRWKYYTSIDADVLEAEVQRMSATTSGERTPYSQVRANEDWRYRYY